MLLVLALALAQVPNSLRAQNAWGWDETMHVGLPAWRMVVGASTGSWSDVADALHDCERYPFVGPVALAIAQAVHGISGGSAIALGRYVWCATLLGVLWTAREIARALQQDGEAPSHSAGLLALACAATSGLALGFAGTLMLEVPATCAVALALGAWVARANAVVECAQRRRDWIAGACLTALFFTKFNYALVVWAAVAIDAAIELVAAARRGALAEYAERIARVAVIPLVALAWWFVLPAPFAFERAAEHRAAFADWLAGNQDGSPAAAGQRLLNLAGLFAFNPRMLAVLAVGALASWRAAIRPGARAVCVALALLAVAIWTHPYHLPRFWIPLGAALWPLAGVGWSRILPKGNLARAAIVLALALAVGIAPGADTMALADRLGIASKDPKVREYQATVFAEYRDLLGQRVLRNSGLPHEEANAFLDLAAREVGPDERVGWLDLTEEVSPAGLQLGLYRRGGSAERFLAQTREQTYASIRGADPGWDDAALVAFAQRFDVVLCTEPHHLKGRRDREFFARYVERLVALGWEKRRIGEVAVSRPLQEPLVVQVFALRRRG